MEKTVILRKCLYLCVLWIISADLLDENSPKNRTLYDMKNVVLSCFGGYTACVDNRSGAHFIHKSCKEVIIRKCHIIIYKLK